MFEKEAEEHTKKKVCEDCTYKCYTEKILKSNRLDCFAYAREYRTFKDGYKCGYDKANEWHNLNENYKDLPNEGEWVEGLYIWYYKDEPHWDVVKVRWYYEIGELDEKLVRWYGADEYNTYDRDYWNKVDEPDYWRKITLPTRNEHDRKY